MEISTISIVSLNVFLIQSRLLKDNLRLLNDSQGLLNDDHRSVNDGAVYGSEIILRFSMKVVRKILTKDPVLIPLYA